MKQGMEINQLRSAIELEQAGRADYLAPFESIRYSWEDIGQARCVPRFSIHSEVTGSHKLSQYAMNQAAAQIKMPARFSQHLAATDPDAWVSLMNRLREREQFKAEKLIRTNSHGVRAMLSPSYAVIDNGAILDTALASMADIGCTQIASCNLGDTMHVKALFPHLMEDVKPGDAVQAGLLLRNSEIGGGSITVQGFIYRLICTNGMTVMDTGEQFFRRVHHGKRVDTFLPDGRVNPDFYAPAIVATQDRLAEAIDAIGDGGFMQTIERMRAAAARAEIEDVDAAMKALRRDMGGLNTAMTDDFAERLLRDGDLTQYGMVNAITNAANDADTYEQATEWEALGGRVLALSDRQWARFARAA